MAELTLDRVGREVMFASFFGNAPRATTAFMVERLGASIEAVPLRAGAVLWKEGDPTDNVFFMPDGRIRAHAEGRPDWVYDGRWALGATDVTLRRPRSRTMTLERDAIVFRIPAALYFDLLEDNSDICANAILGNSRGLLRLWSEIGDGGALVVPRAAGPYHDEETPVGRALLLGAADVLRGASAQGLADLAATSRVVDLEAGEIVLGPGRPSRRLHLLVRGRVDATREGPTLRPTFGPGDTVAAAVFLAGEPGWTVRAAEPSRLITFGIDDWLDGMEEHPEMAVSALGAMSLERERLQDVLAARVGELVMK